MGALGIGSLTQARGPSMVATMVVTRNAIALATVSILVFIVVFITQHDSAVFVVQEESFVPLVAPGDLAELHPARDAEKFMDDTSFWNSVHAPQIVKDVCRYHEISF